MKLITRYRVPGCENCNISVNNWEDRVGFQPFDYSETDPPIKRTPSIKRTLIRACLHGGGGPQEGEVTCLGGVTRLSK